MNQLIAELVAIKDGHVKSKSSLDSISLTKGIKKEANVLSLLSIIFILSWNVLYGHSFKPEPRGGHMATLVNNKIYFMGGSRPIPKNSPEWNQTHQYNLSDEVFYLDLSSQFNIDSPPFTNLSDISRMPFGSEKGSTVLGDSGQRIYLNGGVQQNMATFNYNASDSILWIYTIKSRQWSTTGPGTHGTLLPRRRSTATIINSKNVIYIFGGRVDLDTGGVTQNNPGEDAIRILMTEIYIFDTVQSTWLLQTANSPSPLNIDPRVGHTAVLAPDNNTIVILGGTQSYGINQTTPYPVFVLLDVKSEPFQYSAPTPSGSIPPPLAFHTATLYQDYMIVAFGNITNDYGPPNDTSADIYLMKLSNPSSYTW
ncbi:12177_t:CDS:2, partial [Gigaspora margarita]